MQKITRLLLNEKIPVLVTVLFGAFGWITTHIADRIFHSAAVEYRYTFEQTFDQQNGRKLVVQLRNLSSTETYKGVLIRLTSQRGSNSLSFEKDSCSVSPVAPTTLGTNEGDAKCDENTVEYSLPLLPPRGQALLTAKAYGDGEPIVQGGPTNPNHNSSFFLTKCSLATMLAWHETLVLSITLAIWILLTVLIIWLSENKKKNQRRRENA